MLYLGSAPTLGDGAIGDGLLRRLRHAWPGLELVILTSTPRFYANLPSAAGARLGEKPELRPEVPARGGPRGIHHRVPNPLAAWRTLARLRALDRDRVADLSAETAELFRRTYGWADLVVHQGGPQWTDRWLGPGSLRFHAHRLAAGRGPGRPLALLGQGCGPFRWDGGPRAALRRRFARRVLGRCTAVVTRDAAGAASLRRLGLPTAGIFEAADPALLLQPRASEAGHRWRGFLAGRPRPVLAVALRGLRREYPELQRRQGDVRRRLAELLDLAAESFSLVALSTGGEEDRRALAEVEALRTGEPVFVAGATAGGESGLPAPETLTPAELAHVYAGCHLLLAVRLHPAILAATAGVPSLSLTYDAKGEHFAAQSGLEPFTHPLGSFSPGAAAAGLAALDRRRDAVATELSARVETLRQRTTGALDAAFRRLEEVARRERGAQERGRSRPRVADLGAAG